MQYIASSNTVIVHLVIRMAEKSKKSKKPKKPAVQIDSDEFPRLFKYLPLDVFRKYTNIEDLITAQYKKTHKGKSPPGIHMNKYAERYHKQMTELDDWQGTILEKLDYKWPSEHKEYVKQ